MNRGGIVAPAIALALAAVSIGGFGSPPRAAATDSPSPPGVVAAPPPAAAAPGPALTSIDVARDAAGTTVTLAGDAPLPYEYFLIEGRSLVLDVEAAAAPGVPPEQVLDDPLVSRLRVARRTGSRTGTRVVLDLRAATPLRVDGDGARIVVTLAASAPSAPPPVARGAAAEPRVTDLRGAPRDGGFEVVVAGGPDLRHRLGDSGDPRRISLELPGASLAPSVPRSLDLAAAGGVLLRVSAEQVAVAPPTSRILLELREAAPFRIAGSPEGIAIVVSGAQPPPVAAAPGGYSGSLISLDFVDSDILDIFRLLADVSGRNIVASDDVKGRRTIHVTNLPWDQALDLILQTNTPRLTQVREGGDVIRVTTVKRVVDERRESERALLELGEIEAKKLALEKEAEAARRESEREERHRSEPLELRTFSLSYADAKSLAERLKQYRSDRPEGLFEFDERSNTIVVQDLPSRVATMGRIVGLVDRPTPTVMVEARIVEVLSDFSHAIGVQWGGSYRADAAHGNATGYAFPNSIAVGGAVAQGADGINPGTYLVNLPAAAPVAGVGLSLGHVANTAALDIRLSALEKMGKTKILSNPKVLVIQNENAKINVGSQLPVPKTDSEGNRTVDWKDVGILLQVKPHITYDQRVFMELSIEKSSRGETVRTTEGEMFSIETRNAVTKVLVGDGETSVIGGIYIESTTESQTGVPWFQRIPLLGWLFKSRAALGDRKELMIFLTPRITVPRTPPDAAAALP